MPETTAIYIERDTDRKIRHRNKLHYRFNHWPIWIFVFFIAPGPLTFDLFERGFDRRLAAWLGLVLLGTAIAGLRGRLPGCEPRPYIIRFTEDRPNPLYRRICYTTADYATARDEFQACLQLQADYPEALENLGLAYEGLESFVLLGMPVEQLTAQPVLRPLPLLEQLQSVAAGSGWTCELSEKGQFGLAATTATAMTCATGTGTDLRMFAASPRPVTMPMRAHMP